MNHVYAKSSDMGLILMKSFPLYYNDYDYYYYYYD